MKIGLIARADNSGLGIQTHEFFKHMDPVRTMVVDISKLNGNKIFPERFPGALVTNGFPGAREIDWFLDGLDVVFVAEAPYNFYLYERAKELGVKVAVQYNYEFFDWFANPYLPTPDMLIAPSKWFYEKVEEFCNTRNIVHTYLHCPVNRTLLANRGVREAKTFLHMGGRAAAHDRNGTETVIRAAQHLKSDAKIVVHFQGEQGLAHQATKTTEDYKNLARELNLPNLTIVTQEFANYADIYAMGDVLLLPRRYGGNCLPLNEALSIGMPVIMTDINPNNQFLPKKWLVPAVKIDQFEPRTKIDIYGSDPIALAAKIDEFAEMHTNEIFRESLTANHLADTISWETLKPKYLEAFEQLIGNKAR